MSRVVQSTFPKQSSLGYVEAKMIFEFLFVRLCVTCVATEGEIGAASVPGFHFEL